MKAHSRLNRIFTAPCRRSVSRLAALLLAAALTLTLSAAPAAASEAVGTELTRQSVQVAPGVTVTSQVLWGRDYDDFCRENYITYVPDGTVRPVVAYGKYVSSLQSLTGMARTLEEQGQRVLAGINGGFYEMKNGMPLGVIISGGQLLSTSIDFYVLGFREDGSAQMGQPKFYINAAWSTRERVETDEEGNENVIPAADYTVAVSGFNKIRNDGGYYLYSDANAATTRNNIAGVDVVMRPLEPAAGLPVNGSMECIVERIRDSAEDNSIPAGCFILSMNNNSPAEKLAALAGLQEGDWVTLTASVEEEWQDITEAVSGLYELVAEGQPATGIPSDGRGPRTAVGQRADGGLIFYTVDGRRSGHSMGATYAQVARRLIELGCVTAVALDGGGSTSLGYTDPGADAFAMMNRSSDAAPRGVSNCLFLTVPAQSATGELGSFRVEAESGALLAGTSTALRVTAMDTACRAMEWDGELTWTAGHGRVEPDEDGGWRYTAEETDANVFDTVTVAGDGVTGTAEIKVVGELTSIALRNEAAGTVLSALELRPGYTVELTAVGLHYGLAVSAGNEDYVWQADGDAGTFDELGRFVTADAPGTGTITVTGGGQTVSVPVNVRGNTPFVDTDQYWGREYIDKLYLRGLIGGTVGEDGLVRFNPNGVIQRGELLTMVVRMTGVDVTQYSRVELPFADAGEIPGWMRPYIQAAYAMGMLTGSVREDALYADAGAAITREAAMTLIGRALGRSLEADLSVFADADAVSSWARPYVRTLVAMGIVSGSGGSLNPTGSLTRGEAVKLVYEAMERM